MKYNTSESWINALDVLKKRPVIFLPFLIIAFFEFLALELIYFFPREPISLIVNPVIKKFFGAAFVHYPRNYLITPQLFYYADIIIYVFIGVFLIAISINTFKNIKSKLPIKIKPLLTNAASRYPAFLAYGLLMVALVLLLKRIDSLILMKLFNFASKFIPNLVRKLYPFVSSSFLFFTNIILQVFFILTLPILVIQKTSIIRALGKSIFTGVRHFLPIFILIFIPFLLYFPISLLKSFQLALIDKTFPEITILITIIGIVMTTFIDCFVIVCVSQFLLDANKARPKTDNR